MRLDILKIKAKEKLFALLNQPFFRFVFLPGLFVYVCLVFISLRPKSATLVALVPSFLIALVGWLNSASLNQKSFVKSESSKHRDAVSSFVDKLFDDLDEKRKSSSFSTSSEDFITGRVTLLELRIKHWSFRTHVEFILPEKLRDLRELALAEICSDGYEKHLMALRFETLEHIEEQYSKWFKKNDI